MIFRTEQPGRGFHNYRSGDPPMKRQLRLNHSLVQDSNSNSQTINEISVNLKEGSKFRYK